MKIGTLKILLLLVCVIMMFNHVITIERTHKKRHSRQLSLTTNSPLAKFIEGILSGAAVGDNSWMKCLPAKWRTEGQAEAEGNILGEQFNTMNAAGQQILKILDQIVGTLCPVKDQVASILNIIFKVEGRFFMEGRFGTHRNTRKMFLINLKAVPNSAIKGVKNAAGAVGNAAGAVGNAAKGVVGNAVGAVGNNAVKAYQGLKAAAQTVMAKASEWFVKIKDFFKNVLSSIDLPIIKDLFACIENAKDTTRNLKELAVGLKQKVTMLSSGNTPYNIKFILNLVCNKSAFIGFVNNISTGIKQNNKGTKFLHFGKAIGQALQTVVSSRRRFK